VADRSTAVSSRRISDWDREFILQKFDETIRIAERGHDENNRPEPFDSKNPRIPVTQKVLDADDHRAMIDAVLEGNLTHGRHAKEFEQGLCKVFDTRNASFCNSGSSANLLALAALMQSEAGECRLRRGDKVVVCAAGFPTTVAPVIQLGLVPVFVDCEIPSYLPNARQVYDVMQRSKCTMMLAHTLGNVLKIPRNRHYFYIDDCCDALGSLEDDGKHVGRWATLSTCSFYPAHHITTGEGGAVMCDSPQLAMAVDSLRDWGRDCWCEPGKDNTCGRRFDWQFGHGKVRGVETVVMDCDASCLPYGYDHKHIFSHLGYNLKATDIQAALGVSQLKKLPQFCEARKRNWQRLHDGLADLQGRIVLPEPTPGTSPSWFGFAITLNPPLERRYVVEYLESKGVATRPIFAGNILRQPMMRGVEYEVVGDLSNADRVMRDSFYVGVHPGLTEEHVEYELKTLREALTVS
jgi:CDP-6-deoxy-D-xylo-4-hexulose-3-dehydrase